MQLLHPFTKLAQPLMQPTIDQFPPSLCSPRYSSVPSIQWFTLTSRRTSSLHSISTCLTDVTNRLLHNMDKGQLTGMVFLDLSKAFDTIDHDIMLNKLISLGFSDSAVLWFKAYLTNRSQSVRVNGIVSDPQSIPFVVPQGLILGPLLFLSYIKDLSSVLEECDIQLYADDTLLLYSSNSVTTRVKTVQI